MALVALGVLASCGTDVREIEPERAPDLSLLDASGHREYLPASSPAKLIEERNPPAIVVGSVESVEQGRDVYAVPDPAEGEDPDPQLVMEVWVSDELKVADDSQVSDGRVYVEMRQGGTYNDGSGPRFPLEEWREAIPVGTRVMLPLHAKTEPELNDHPTENEGRGLPDGAQLLVADPQGMIFEFNGQLVGQDHGGGTDVGWDVGSIDEISAQVRDHLGR